MACIALGIQAVRGTSWPRFARFPGRPVRRIKVFGDAEGAFGNPGIAGGAGLRQVVVEGQVETVALAGQFGGEQGEQACPG